ncbi:hypothetical protein Fot_20959 [Forsythia ovata]|uniref:Uncharacterized protein n=1 Tax=Forsythia ovata TaxID=205694 RepID=A0ABD1UTG6_9LAMI
MTTTAATDTWSLSNMFNVSSDSRYHTTCSECNLSTHPNLYITNHFLEALPYHKRKSSYYMPNVDSIQCTHRIANARVSTSTAIVHHPDHHCFTTANKHCADLRLLLPFSATIAPPSVS